MITYSGRKVNRDLAELPTCEDIAVGLGRICRWAGAVWWPDLAHSVLVALILDEEGADDLTWAWGIVHDAHEAVTGDVTWPWKPVSLRVQQDGIDEKLRVAFNLPRKQDVRVPLLEKADDDAADAEAIALGLPNWAEYHEEETGNPPEVNKLHIAWVAALAASEFALPQHCTRPDSTAVRTFAAILRLIRGGSYGLAREKLVEAVRVPVVAQAVREVTA